MPRAKKSAQNTETTEATEKREKAPAQKKSGEKKATDIKKTTEKQPGKTAKKPSSGDEKATDIKKQTKKKENAEPKKDTDNKKETVTGGQDKKASHPGKGDKPKDGTEKKTGTKKAPKKTEETPPKEEVKEAKKDTGQKNKPEKSSSRASRTRARKEPEPQAAPVAPPQPAPEPRPQAQEPAQAPEGQTAAPRRRTHRAGRHRRRAAAPQVETSQTLQALIPPAPPPQPPLLALPEPRPAPAPVSPREKRGRSVYPAEEFSSVEMMSSLKGFAPMGMLFVLMDILKGHEEGLIHVNQLAQALGIGKPSVFAQLENLEAAGLLRTISSSRAGRHIELLTPNLFRHSALELYPTGASGSLLAPGGPERGGQFSQKRLEFLRAYVKGHGIKIVSTPSEADLPARVAQIASYMGKYFDYIQDLYNLLKSTLNEGQEVQYPMANRSGRRVTHVMTLTRMLRDAGFITFEYLRSKKLLTAKVQRAPDAINFLSGGWLEHYIRDKVVSILTTHPATLALPYAFLKNPNITLPGGEPFELDFLLAVGDRVFWIEAKTGEYKDYLAKYSRVSKVLGLNRTASMLVSVDPLAPDDNLTARYSLSCCNLDEFPDVFRINLVRELQQEAAQRAAG